MARPFESLAGYAACCGVPEGVYCTGCPRLGEVDPCPKGDPECETGDDGSCHDGCESPRTETRRGPFWIGDEAGYPIDRFGTQYACAPLGLYRYGVNEAEFRALVRGAAPAATEDASHA